MAAFDDCTAAVNAQQGAKVAADLQAREISKQKFQDAQREKAGMFAWLHTAASVAFSLLH